MRIDLKASPFRPFFQRVFLEVARRLVGGELWPLMAMTYRPTLIAPAYRGMLLRAMHPSPSWDKGTLELHAAYISRLNSCHW